MPANQKQLVSSFSLKHDRLVFQDKDNTDGNEGYYCKHFTFFEKMLCLFGNAVDLQESDFI